MYSGVFESVWECSTAKLSDWYVRVGTSSYTSRTATLFFQLNYCFKLVEIACLLPKVNNVLSNNVIYFNGKLRCFTIDRYLPFVKCTYAAVKLIKLLVNFYHCRSFFDCGSPTQTRPQVELINDNAACTNYFVVDNTYWFKEIASNITYTYGMRKIHKIWIDVSLKILIRELMQTTTVTATRTPPNKRFMSRNIAVHRNALSSVPFNI